MEKTHMSLCVFSLALLFSSLTIHARDVPSPSPAPVEPESENGYGLYGRDSTQYEATTYTNANDENGTPSDGLGGDSYPNYNTGYTNTNDEGLGGQSLMSNNNNDANSYNSEWYQPEKRRSNEDNYLGGYETEHKDGWSNGNYYGNNFKYEFESMEEYDKYQRTKGGYWP